MKKCIVTIPLYKSNLTETERKSLLRSFEVLKNYDFAFICPNSLDISNYTNEAQVCNINFKILRFNDKYFSNVRAYSLFMLDSALYKKLNEYEYMLIYQLDAFVFEDKLEYWCNQGYDYIGAPWFEGFNVSDDKSPLMKVAGNGGFCLRKISSVLKVIKNMYKMPYYMYFEDFKKGKFAKDIINFPLYLIKCVIKKKKYSPKLRINEDYLLAFYGKLLHKGFRVAPPEIALQFSFETQPKRLFEMNNKKLPFGCHAFEKYEPEFWAEFIN